MTALLVELLRSAAGPNAESTAQHLASTAAVADEREFRWLVDAGLGPLLYRNVRSHLDRLPERRSEVLHASDLVALVRHGALIDTSIDLIDTAAAVGVPLTLLKGISISEQYYPSGHLRRMSDVDVLIPAESYAGMESELLRRGYARGSKPYNPDLPHGIPIGNVERGTWVELHTAMFPRSSELLEGTTFTLGTIAANSVDSTLASRPVQRLSDELQIIYIACSWNLDLTLCRYHPSFAAALFDAAFLLRSSGAQLRWDRVLQMVDNDMAAASLLVLLATLSRHGLCNTPPILRDLAARQRLVGPIQLRAILTGIDRYELGARRWSFPLPPPVVGRYKLSRQLRKRLGRSMARDGD